MNNNNKNNKRKILHLLTWEFKNIEYNLDKIKATGFTAIQISPIQQCKPLWDNNGTITKGSYEWHTVINREWWKLYQPVAFTIGNFLGNEEDFISLCNACKQIGIEIYVDVILRHVANRDNGSRLEPHENVDKELLKYLKTTQHDTMNYHDRFQLINHCTGLPMFDYNNIEFQNEHVMPFLMKILKYADGIRFDQLCKHYALPSEGGSIFENVIAKLPKDKYYYGEGIEIPSHIFDEYAEYVDVLCPYHENWGKQKSVRFCESHDTCLSFLYSLSMNDSARLQGYEDCLRQYNNVIYFARRNDNTIFSDKMKEINNRY